MLINCDSALSDAASQIKESDIISVDLEFMRKRQLYPTLALIQIATRSDIYIIDSVRIKDLSLLVPILSDRKTLKVMYSPSQDIEIIKQVFDVELKNIVDIQLSCLFHVFSDLVSYNKSVSHFFDVHLNKSLQYSNWLKRPISEAALAYASDDVKYLIPLYESVHMSLAQEFQDLVLLEENYIVNTEVSYQAFRATMSLARRRDTRGSSGKHMEGSKIPGTDR